MREGGMRKVECGMGNGEGRKKKRESGMEKGNAEGKW